MKLEIRFKLEKETKGALRFQEVDDKGDVAGRYCRKPLPGGAPVISEDTPDV